MNGLPNNQVFPITFPYILYKIGALFPGLAEGRHGRFIGREVMN
jgi:hypothetical protein